MNVSMQNKPDKINKRDGESKEEISNCQVQSCFSHGSFRDSDLENELLQSNKKNAQKWDTSLWCEVSRFACSFSFLTAVVLTFKRSVLRFLGFISLHGNKSNELK